MLYFATTENYVKIGQSDDPVNRVRQMQIGCPLPLKLTGVMPGNKNDEKAIQRLFKDSHIHGEWFRLDKTIIDYIDKYADRRTL
jgi:hypothetical protein